MKHSWVMSVVMLWLLIFGLEMMVTEGTAFNTTQFDRLQAMMAPTMTNQSSVVTSIVSLAVKAGDYFMTFVNALFLWSPSVWTGYLYWVWFYLCLPLSITMVIGVLIVMRGGSSG